MYKTLRILCIVSLALTATRVACSQDRGELLTALLPGALATEGWSAMDRARVYRGERLYNFIDGGADLFMEYGFQQALSLQYQNARGTSIDLEIYEMCDTAASYGIYSIRSGGGGTPFGIGEEGMVHSHYIMFWKAKYYVSVAGSDMTEECKQGLEVIARAVARNIPASGQKPSLMNLLPQENLLRTAYVRGYLGLSTIYVPGVNDLFPASGAALGAYQDHMLILLRYEDAAQSRERMELIAKMLNAGDRAGGFECQDDPVCSVDTKNRSLCLCHSAPYIILAVSPDASLAASSLRKAVFFLHAR